MVLSTDTVTSKLIVDVLKICIPSSYGYNFAGEFLFFGFMAGISSFSGKIYNKTGSEKQKAPFFHQLSHNPSALESACKILPGTAQPSCQLLYILKQTPLNEGVEDSWIAASRVSDIFSPKLSVNEPPA